MRKGTPLHIVMVDDIVANWNGDDKQDKIRNWMKDVYDAYGTLAFLLVGDSQRPTGTYSTAWGRYGVVPSRHVCEASDDLIHPSDFYYACLEGSWGPIPDSTSGYFGTQSQNLKLKPTVLVGRVPVGDNDPPAPGMGESAAVTETENWVAKLIKYEKNPSTAYLDDVLFIGSDFGYKWCNNTLWNNGNGYFPGFSESHVYEGTGQNNPDPYSNYVTYPEPHEVEEALNASAGITVVAAHGLPWGYYVLTQGQADPPQAPYVQTFTVDEDFPLSQTYMLNYATGLKETDVNDEYGLMYAVSCSTFRYDVRNDEGVECMGEEYLTDNYGGGAAYIGATTGASSFGSFPIGEYFFEYLTKSTETPGDDNYVLGVPHMYSRERRCVDKGGPDRDAYTFNLGGDPTMEVWTDVPGALDITYDWRDDGPYYTLEVTVKDAANNPVENAKVCLWQQMYYLTQNTSDEGYVEFRGLVSGFNDGKLTATKHNYKPDYVDSVVVGP